MPYVPHDPQVYSAAYAGAISGIEIGGRFPTSPNLGYYAKVAAVAEVWAERFDQLFFNAFVGTPLTQTDLGIINQGSQDMWSNRYPTSLVPSYYDIPIKAILAIIAQSRLVACSVPITGTGPQGVPGPQGSPQGWQGNQGYQGSPQGYQGYQGNIGAAGPQGSPQGYQGYQGNPSTTQGSQGYQGNQGDIGTGTQGNQGYQGDQSSIAGPQGDTGPQGSPQGWQGDQGYQGDLGPQGSPQGWQGDQGYQGNQGAQGDILYNGMYYARGVVLSNISDLGAFTVIGGQDYDGITYVDGDTVLLAAQTTLQENGPYVVSNVGSGTGTLARPWWWTFGSLKNYGAEITLGSEGFQFGSTNWRIYTGNSGPYTYITVDFENPDLWPTRWEISQVLESGLLVLNGPIRSANTKVFVIRQGTGTGSSTTVQYCAGQVTPGVGFTGSVVVYAYDNNLTQVITDESILHLLVINK